MKLVKNKFEVAVISMATVQVPAVRNSGKIKFALDSLVQITFLL